MSEHPLGEYLRARRGQVAAELARFGYTPDREAPRAPQLQPAAARRLQTTLSSGDGSLVARMAARRGGV